MLTSLLLLRYVFIVTLYPVIVVSSYPQGSYVAVSSPHHPQMQVKWEGTAPPIFVAKSRDDIEKIAFLAPAALAAARSIGTKVLGGVARGAAGAAGAAKGAAG